MTSIALSMASGDLVINASATTGPLLASFRARITGQEKRLFRRASVKNRLALEGLEENRKR